MSGESSYTNSIRAQRRLGEATSALNRTYERLSSGLRINRASDDAAGLAVSSSLNVSQRVFTQGARNLNDGISLLSVADATLGQLSDITTRLQELASQAVNGTYSNNQRGALDIEAQQLASEYFRLSRSATFGKINLFDGSLQGIRLQSGFGVDGGISSSLGGTLGTGRFSASSTLAGSGGDNYASADLNGDGFADLVTISSGTISIRYATGTGTFASASTISTGSSKDKVGLGDINGDGTIDIVVSGDLNFQTFYNQGNGSYTAGRNIQLTGQTADFQGNLLVGDVDGDGKADIIVSDYFSDTGGVTFYVQRSLGGDSFKRTFLGGVPSGNFGLGAAAANVRLADVNGDGKQDLLVGSTFNSGLNNDGYLNIALGDGTGSFSSFNTALTFANAVLYDFAVGDLNKDGKVDIAFSVVSDSGTPTLQTYTGNGQGSFSLKQSLNTGTTASFLEIGDLNGDGSLDLLEKRSDGSLGSRIGSGSGTFGTFTQSGSSSDGVRSFALADYNNDGVLDFYDGTVGILRGVTRDGISPLESFSLKTRTDALQALPKFANLRDRISLQRGQIGSLQSRLETSLNVTRVTAEATGTAASRITDVDVASSTADLARFQILQNIAASVLAQANLQPQITLALIK